MGRLILLLLMLSTLPSCVVMTTVAGAVGTAAEGVAYLFKDEKKSMPVGMREALVAMQRSLKKMELPATLVEPVPDGYMLSFGNGKLDGRAHLIRQTRRLTTIGVTIRDGSVGRASSVEAALFETVREQVKHVHSRDRFNFSGYNNVRQRPTIQSDRVGWYLPGARLEVKKSRVEGWLSIKMPSGKRAFLKGEIGKDGGVG